jgi:hypothetical protein
MAKDQSKRLTPARLVEDTSTHDALKNVAGYTPSNPQFTVANNTSVFNTMIAAQTAENQAIAALATARDQAVAAEWAFHNAMLGSKTQVAAQFGKDSNQVQAIGLKKTSEYKKPKRVEKKP